MLRWALIFLIVALIAAVLGFGGIAGTAAGIAKILFIVFIVIFLVSLILHLARGKDPWVDWRPVSESARLMIDALIRGLTKPFAPEAQP